MSEPKTKPKGPGKLPETETGKAGPAVLLKVAPYPIEVSILRPGNPAPFKGSIVKLTEFGFLMRVGSELFFSVGETQTVEFVIPVLNHRLSCNTRVIKTYDSMAFSATEKLKMVELHFVSLPLAHTEAIRKYLVNSGQAKPE
jgi:hypothetical protein